MKYETKDGFARKPVEQTPHDQIKEILERVAVMIDNQKKDKESDEDQSCNKFAGM